MKKFVLALDEGTTSARSLLYDISAKRVSAIRSREISQLYPRDGWVEEDAEEIWNAQLETVHEVLSAAGADVSDIACVGITNQRETVVAWDRITGKPLTRAIVWQCRRTAEFCESLKAAGKAEIIRKKTGLPIDAYFSAAKIRWMIENVGDVSKALAEGRLMVGTVDSWLIYRLSGGRLHITDKTNASRTMLYNIHSLEWDKELLELFGIPLACLPEVRDSSGMLGRTAPEIMGAEIPISGVAGDQQAALFGQCCFDTGSVKNTYGTGGFILMNTGDKAVSSQNGLITTIAWGMGGKAVYALEGSVFNAGSTVQWLRDELGLIKTAPEASAIALKTPDTGGVYIVPAFTGLGAPYWDMYARGLICGLTRATGKNHIIRAGLESIAYQSLDVFSAMEADSGVKLRELKADGGASASDFLMQFQADMLGATVLRPKNRETTAMGACLLAGLGAGVFESFEDIRVLWELDFAFEPQMDEARRNGLLKGWKRAVGRAINI